MKWKWMFGFFILMSSKIPAQFESKGGLTDSTIGILFVQNRSWKNILDESKLQNKYVFVDCYATWCGPCKEMEKSVYSLETVGGYFRQRFISVKMQMDSSSKDEKFIKDRYADAHDMLAHYGINAYPSFLFFNSDGKLINRGVGAKSPEEFLAMAADAVSPEKDYYLLLNKFHDGMRNPASMTFLARQGLLLGDTTGSAEVARAYIGNLKNPSLLTVDNIGFLREFTKRSSERGFNFFYKYADSIDKVMKDDVYAEQFVQTIIYNEMVLPEFKKAKHNSETPDWQTIRTRIKNNYNTYYADRVITGARADWALSLKKMKEYTHYLTQFEDKYGSKTNSGLLASLTLNNCAWAIFLYSDNTYELERALNWSMRAVMMYPIPNWMDTYANILYKLGRKEEAKLWEKNASDLDPNDENIKSSLDKMMSGKVI